MASYVGKINIGGTEYPIGSTLYGTCSGVADGDSTSYAVSMGNFDKLETGITIHVKFTKASISGATKLKVGNQAAKTIINPSGQGQISWSADSVISFTYDGTNWVMNTGTIPQGTVTSVRVQASSPLQSSTSTAQSSSLSTTISFTNQNANTVLAGPSSGSAAAPGFRALVSADIPSSLALSGTPTAPTANAGTNSTQIATTAFVATAISNSFAAADAMVFKGTIGEGGTPGELPTSGYSAGATYKVIKQGTYAGMVCEAGDLLIAIKDGPASGSSVINTDWTSVQTNDAGLVTGPSSSTTNNLALFDGATGNIIKDSGVTLNTASGSTTKWLTQKGTWTTPTAANVGAAASTHVQAVDKGGTNITAYTKGDILYASDPTTLTKLGIGTANQILKATTNGPSWSTPSISVTSNTNGSVVTGVTLNTGTAPSFTQGTLATATVADGTLTLTNQTKDTFNEGAYPTLKTISKADLGVSLS